MIWKDKNTRDFRSWDKKICQRGPEESGSFSEGVKRFLCGERGICAGFEDDLKGRGDGTGFVQHMKDIRLQDNELLQAEV